jgi:hypothetical protein
LVSQGYTTGRQPRAAGSSAWAIEQRSVAAAGPGADTGSRNEGTCFGKLFCKKGTPGEVWIALLEQFNIVAVYANEDYEPYAIARDSEIEGLLAQKGVLFHLCKDQVTFARDEVVKKDRTPCTLFTPYKNAWIKKFAELHVKPIQNLLEDPLHEPLPARLQTGLPARLQTGLPARLQTGLPA